MLNPRLFRNTLTANDNYPVQDCENLPSPIQMSLSLERNFFSHLFVPFLESTSDFKHFEKKGDSHSYFICENRHSERNGEATL